MKLSTNLLLSTLTLSLSLGLTGCGQDAAQEAAAKAGDAAEKAGEVVEKVEGAAEKVEETAEKVEAAVSGDVIRVATEGAYPPLNFTNSEGEVVGFDVDVTNALCEEMKAKCEIVAQEWDGIIPGLLAKKYDAIVAGMSITDERKKVVDFTDPYFSSGLILMAKADSDLTFENLAGKTVGAQKATIALSYAEENLKDATVKSHDTQEGVNADLVNGRMDAVVVDQVVGTAWLDTDGAKGFAQKGESISTGKDDMGIAVRQGDELKGKFNTALAAIKANGTYDKISAKYFGAK